MIETQKMNGLCFYEIIEIGRPMTFDTIEIEERSLQATNMHVEVVQH